MTRHLTIAAAALLASIAGTRLPQPSGW